MLSGPPGQAPILGVRTEWLVMQVAIHPVGPRRPPRLDHHQSTTRPKGAARLSQKLGNVRYVVQHIRHDNGIEGPIRECERGGILDPVHSFQGKDLARHYLRKELAQVAGTGADLEHVGT